MHWGDFLRQSTGRDRETKTNACVNFKQCIRCEINENGVLCIHNTHKCGLRSHKCYIYYTFSRIQTIGYNYSNSRRCFVLISFEKERPWTKMKKIAQQQGAAIIRVQLSSLPAWPQPHLFSRYSFRTWVPRRFNISNFNFSHCTLNHIEINETFYD